jgi:hypothetical protein
MQRPVYLAAFRPSKTTFPDVAGISSKIVRPSVDFPQPDSLYQAEHFTLPQRKRKAVYGLDGSNSALENETDMRVVSPRRYFFGSKSGRYRSSPSSFSFSTGTKRSAAEFMQ